MQQLLKHVLKRNGNVVPFDQDRIQSAIYKAFISENNSDRVEVERVVAQVVKTVQERQKEDVPSVEFIQDIVEETLMVCGYHKIARNYILYREKHKVARQEKVYHQIQEHSLEIKINDSETIIFNPSQIEETIRQLTPDLMRVSVTEMVDAVQAQIYDKIPQREVDLIVLNVAKERIEKHYEYSNLAARIATSYLYQSILGCSMNTQRVDSEYKNRFEAYINKGIEAEMLSPELGEFNLDRLAAALRPERDKLFHYLGIQIVVDRYLLRDRSSGKSVYELPQWFWMRVAMGLAIKENEKELRAIEFYNVLSQLDLVSSTPTLFNSGTCHSQMSSCYLNLAEDSLDGIFKLYQDNAQLSKWAGGIGTDWSFIRATGSKIKGTNGESQGVIPFIKIFNDVALAVNQGGKRKGAMCAYMEVWHLDFEQFLELKKNTGDERRRAHDINTAAWIPDLFMKRVQSNGDWTFFCPGDAPELHDLYGAAFEKRYEEYEAMNLPRAKRVKASDLWRKMITMLYETGHPWITFKDAANVRSPQDHVGVVHSSNLCTEITLNTSKDETAVCNLASVNLSNMIVDGKLDEEKLSRTVSTGIRMLDNVIDNNYYPTKEAEKANMRHRAVGLGMMGYQDALYKLNYAYASEEALEFADYSMEMISYYAIFSSSKLAKERGAYQTFKGSKWDRGIMPLDTLDLLEKERGNKVTVNRRARMDWNKVRDHIKEFGMRNSNTMAIAPTATIANISGVYPCTEPVYKNLYMKENLSGNFVVINRYLVDDLERLGMWNEDIVNQIKYYNGSISEIDSIPDHIRTKYQEVFEIQSEWIVKSSAVRSKWIDQSASTNIFASTSSGRFLSDTYMSAWELGMKTTYYLRTIGASQVSKASVKEFSQSKAPEKPVVNGNDIEAVSVSAAAPRVAVLDDPDCEACQ